jgi:hypothetical protein
MKNLRKDIIVACIEKSWNPFDVPFKPSDLDIDASQYGSFSDYCLESATVSGQYANEHILDVAERDENGRPTHYLLAS